MALEINVHHLERGPVSVRGETGMELLDPDPRDDLLEFPGPLRYDLTIERLGAGLVVQGALELPLQCTCVRCLRSFGQVLALDPWYCHVPLEGDDQAVVTHDVVDLTPYVREDILLALPQHPLCEPECRGLPSVPRRQVPDVGLDRPRTHGVSVWAELDKLKF
jgi:uncharacterized protein